MGGQNETVIGGISGKETRINPDIPDPPDPIIQPEVIIGEAINESVVQRQSVRLHINNNQVHFHVDAENLKAALPVAEWYSAWIKIAKSPGSQFHFADLAHNTVLTVQSVYKNNILNAVIEIKKVDKVGSVFNQLENFTRSGGQLM